MRQNRRGISLFEVLISILVAAIGVFGVLVLIPFAVKNAQRGIDQESAINAAKNYYADFQANRLGNPEVWFDDTDLPIPGGMMPALHPNTQVRLVPFPGMTVFPQPVPDQPPTNNTIAYGWPYIMDPVGALGNAAASGEYGRFPADTSPPLLPLDLPRINFLNLLDPDSLDPSSPSSGDHAGQGLGLARRLSLQPDDLKFDPPSSELGPPEQNYFVLDGLPFAKRQYDGRYTTVAFLVPHDDDGQQYTMYNLVGRAGDRGAERVFEVIDPDASPGLQASMRIPKTDTGLPGRQYEQVAIGGGDLRLSEIATGGQPALNEDAIRSGDWLMLVSYYRTSSDTDTFDDIQIDFHRVIHADRVSPPQGSPSGTPGDGVVRGGSTERTFAVTVQGSDFDLYRDWESGSKVAGDRTDVSTYAILIPNVLAVYERTFRVEGDSVWSTD